MNTLLNGNQDSSARKKLPMDLSLAPLEKFNWLIHLQHVKGDIGKCKDLIKQEIKKSNGRNEYALFKQGTILREEGKIQDALESFQMCLKLNPEHVDYVKEVAKCLFLLRRYRLSLEAYYEAERNNHKTDWEICHNIGQCLVRLGDVATAQEYLRKAVQAGKHECSYTLLVKILVGDGDLKSAIEDCSVAVENCPDSSNLLTELGLLHLKVGQVEMAFEKLSQAVALEPSCAKALLGIGCITQTHEEYDVALSKYKLALQTQPNSVAVWNNIGMCFYSKQKYVAAISCLKRALWFSPLNWKVLSNLGLVHFGTMQPASAFNFLCAAVNLRPDVGLNFMMLGCALSELRDPENSLRALRQAARLSPDDPAVALNAAACLLICGETEEAAATLLRAKETPTAAVDTRRRRALAELESGIEAILSANSGDLEDQEINTVENQDAGQSRQKAAVFLNEDEV